MSVLKDRVGREPNDRSDTNLMQDTVVKTLVPDQWN